jgi:hypothetical protein
MTQVLRRICVLDLDFGNPHFFEATLRELLDYFGGKRLWSKGTD